MTLEISTGAGALIITPTYNEKENLPRLVTEIHRVVPEAHILVVDDNSPDGTGDLAASLARRDSRIHVLHREGKLGLGTAYIAGFKYALSKDYERIFEMDADLSHRPEHLPEFLNMSKDYDLVLGCRYMEGGGTEDWGMMRRMLSQGGNLYARTILSLPFQDLTGGFKCFRREVLESIDLDAIGSEGYAFQIELTYRTYRAGYRIGETPIIFPDRTLGRSKMNRKIILEALWRVAKLRGQG